MMGDRANFGLRQSNGHTLFVYVHNGGYEMMHNFAVALSKMLDANRQDDDAYGSRIVVQSLMSDAYSDTLGYGLTIDCLSDNEHSVPVYDFNTETVTLYAGYNKFPLTDPKFTMTLREFIERFM